MREDVLVEWNPWWEDAFEFEFVERNILERIEKWIGRKEVIALTGARRSGKTTLMYIIIKNLLEECAPENILFIKCDDERIEEPIIDGAIEKHAEIFNPKGRLFLFLDEVQNAEDWDKTVKRIYDLHDNIKVFLSGSRLLKKKISATLAGRSAYFSIFPFSFEEFLRSKGLEVETKIDQLAKKKDIKYYLRRYLEFGAFPEVVLEERRQMKKELLKFYSDTILYRDVIKRSGIQKVEKIEKLKNVLLANFANPLNYNKIAHRLKIATDTVSSYIREMERAYYLFSVPIFSYSMKKQQVNPKKIYCVDNGLRNVTGFRFSRDVGRLYENTVFLHLKRRLREEGIYYWKDEKNRETDFLLKKGTSIKNAIQVSYNLEESKEREIKALQSAMEHFELNTGTIVTGKTEGTQQIQGKEVRLIPLWKWLLSTCDILPYLTR